MTVPIRVAAGDSSFPAYATRTVTINSNVPAQAVLATDRDPVPAGEALSYTVDVGNRSDALVSDARYALRLPQDVTFNSASEGGVFDSDANAVVWELGALPAGSRLQRVADVTVNDDTPEATLLLARGELSGAGGGALGAGETEVFEVDARLLNVFNTGELLTLGTRASAPGAGIPPTSATTVTISRP